MPIVFKGVMRPGTVTATFNSDYSNADSDSLTAQYVAIPGFQTDVAVAVAAPGGAAHVSVTAETQGRVVIGVQTGRDNESGVLIVRLNDVVQDSGPIQGSTEWSYAVVEAES